MRSLPDAILVSTWLHFGTKKLSKSHLGGVFGRLRRVLRRPGGICERLGGVLGHFVDVLGLPGSSCGSRGVCRERLGRILGRLGGVQKAFWGVLGVSCMRLGVSWGLLDPSCGHLGNVLGRLGGILCLTFMPNGG